MSAYNLDPAADASAPQRPLVLIVDSLTDVRAAARRTLSEVDCEIAEAVNTLEALRIIAEQDVDVVITGLEPTPGGGLELIWGLRALPVYRQRPEVIVWSVEALARPVASRSEMREVAVALTRGNSDEALLMAVQAVLDDPLAFIEILDD
jgi:CheY-like chemotaxis protein